MSAAHAALARLRKAAAAPAAADVGSFGESGGGPVASAAPVQSLSAAAGGLDSAERAPGAFAGEFGFGEGLGLGLEPTPTSTGEDASLSPQATEMYTENAEITGRLSSTSAADGLPGGGSGGCGSGDGGGGSGGGSAVASGSAPGDADDFLDICGSGAPAMAAASAQELAATADTALGPDPTPNPELGKLDLGGLAPMDCSAGSAGGGGPARLAAGFGSGFAAPVAYPADGGDASDSADRARDSSGAAEGHRSNVPDASAPPTSTTDGGRFAAVPVCSPLFVLRYYKVRCCAAGKDHTLLAASYTTATVATPDVSALLTSTMHGGRFLAVPVDWIFALVIAFALCMQKAQRSTALAGHLLHQRKMFQSGRSLIVSVSSSSICCGTHAFVKKPHAQRRLGAPRAPAAAWRAPLRAAGRRCTPRRRRRRRQLRPWPRCRPRAYAPPPCSRRFNPTSSL